MTNANILKVKKWNYGNYSSDNYGANSIAVEMGKHLNWIDGGDKKSRLTPEEFNAKLQEFLR